jgi:hypothetical protein
MGTYSKKRILAAQATQIPQIADAISREFQYDGFEVNVDNLMSGGRDISITKGNLFKAVLGMRSALKITLTPMTDGVLFDANVGIFGQQAIPTVISMLFFWPVLITQIWGLIQQSSLDDRALAAAERACKQTETRGERREESGLQQSTKFCTSCGARISGTAHFCPECGAKLD